VPGFICSTQRTRRMHQNEVKLLLFASDNAGSEMKKMCRHFAVPITSSALSVMWADRGLCLQVSVGKLWRWVRQAHISSNLNVQGVIWFEVRSCEVCTAKSQIVPKSARLIGAPYSIHPDSPKLLVFWQMVQHFARSALMTETSQCKIPRHSFRSISEIIIFIVCYCLLLLVPLT